MVHFIVPQSVLSFPLFLKQYGGYLITLSELLELCTLQVKIFGTLAQFLPLLMCMSVYVCISIA